VWLATGHPDMREGFGDLALLVQETLNSGIPNPEGPTERASDLASAPRPRSGSYPGLLSFVL
jgi:hypothetical protein